MLCVTEGDVELRLGVLPFLRAMEHCDEVGWGQVAAPVARVGRGADRRRIGGPHRRGRPGRGAQRGILAAVEGERFAQHAIGPRQRQEEALRKPARHIAAHLGEALQRRLARVARLPAMARAGDIAEAEPCVIVRGADDPVEVDFLEHGFPCRHCERPEVARQSMAELIAKRVGHGSPRRFAPRDDESDGYLGTLHTVSPSPTCKVAAPVASIAIVSPSMLREP